MSRYNPHLEVASRRIPPEVLGMIFVLGNRISSGTIPPAPDVTPPWGSTGLWRSTAISIPDLWTRVDYMVDIGIGPGRTPDHDCFREQLSWSKQRPLDITLWLPCYRADLSAADWMALHAVSLEAPRWRSLDVWKPDDAALQHIFRSLPLAKKLEHFTISDDTPVSESGNAEIVTAKSSIPLPSLKSLTLKLPHLYNTPVLFMPSLTRLHLEGVTPNCLNFDDVFPLLDRLEVSKLLPGSLPFYEGPGSQFPSLKTLVINDQHTVEPGNGDHFLMAILENSPNLKSISMKVVSPIPDISEVFEASPHVEELSVTFHTLADECDESDAEDESDTVRVSDWDLHSSSQLLNCFPWTEKVRLGFETKKKTPGPNPIGMLQALGRPTVVIHGLQFPSPILHVELSNFDVDEKSILDLFEAHPARDGAKTPFTVSLSNCCNFPDVKNATHEIFNELFSNYHSKGADTA